MKDGCSVVGVASWHIGSVQCMSLGRFRARFATHSRGERTLARIVYEWHPFDRHGQGMKMKQWGDS